MQENFSSYFPYKEVKVKDHKNRLNIDRLRVSDVRDFFKVFGDLRDVYLPKDFYTKEPKGIAYVE